MTPRTDNHSQKLFDDAVYVVLAIGLVGALEAGSKTAQTAMDIMARAKLKKGVRHFSTNAARTFLDAQKAAGAIVARRK